MDAGGVRLFVKYEQCCQIVTQGPKKTMEEFLLVCNQKKLLQAYDPKEKSANMGLAILEFATLTDGINIFADMCYILEGDSAIILRAGEVFKRRCKWPSVNSVVNDALGLILKRHDTFMHHKQIYSTKLDTSKRIVLESNERVQGLNNEKKIMGVTSQRGCSIVNIARYSNSE